MNLALVRSAAQGEEGGQATVTLRFAEDDSVVLTGEDAKVLRRRFRMASTSASNLKMGIFWAVILFAVVAVFLVLRANRG